MAFGINVLALIPTQPSYNLGDKPVVQCADPTLYVFRTDNDACLGKDGIADIKCIGVDTWFPYNSVQCNSGCPQINYDSATVTVSPWPGCGDAQNGGVVNVSCIDPTFELWQAQTSNTSVPVGYIGGHSIVTICQNPQVWTMDDFICIGTRRKVSIL